MSIQIKKKFIKSQVIDGTKVLFLNEDSFKALNAAGEVAELFKFSNGDKLVMLQMPQVSSDPSADNDLSRKKYVDDSLQTEVEAREAADEVLSGDIANEAARAVGEEARIEGKVDAETTNRIAALSTETSNRVAADTELQNAIGAEQARAIAAEGILEQSISSETTRATAAEGALEQEIVEEQTRAKDAEKVLKDALEQEVLDRSAAVSSEAAARVAEDATFVKLDGSRAMSGNINMGVNSSAPTVTATVLLYDGQGQELYNEAFSASEYSSGNIVYIGNQAYEIYYNQEGGLGWYIVLLNPAQSGPGGPGESSAMVFSTETVEIGTVPSGGNKIVNLAAGTDAFDAVNKGQLDSAISTEQAARDAADSKEAASRDAADSALDASIRAEVTRATAAEEQLQSSIDVERGRIDAILLASDADKDSFAEIVELINSVDTENDSAFASYVLSNNAALAQEVSDRQAGDSALQTSLNSEISARQTAVSAEQTRAEGVEASLQSSIAAEVTARIAAVSAEKTRAESVESSLQSSIAAEVTAREAAVSAEEAAREAADSALDARLDILETDPVTKTYVDNQVATLSSDINTLDGYAQDIRSDLDQEILDRAAAVSAEEAARIAGDNTLQSALNTEVTDRQAAVSAEESARIAGDSALSSSISSEASTRAAADTALQTALNTEISNRITAVSSEAAARAAADGVLDAKIDQKYSDSVSYTDSKVAALVNSAPEVLDTLKELADALGSDPNFATTVAGQIGAEQIAREAADSALDARLDILEGTGPGSFAYELNLYGERFINESFTVDGSMISDGYLDLGFKAFVPSMVVSLDRLMLFEGDDFVVSVVDGKTRLTFAGSIMPAGDEALASGDKIKVRYLKDVR